MRAPGTAQMLPGITPRLGCAVQTCAQGLDFSERPHLSVSFNLSSQGILFTPTDQLNSQPPAPLRAAQSSPHPDLMNQCLKRVTSGYVQTDNRDEDSMCCNTVHDQLKVHIYSSFIEFRGGAFLSWRYFYF